MDERRPRFSVVIPTRERAETLRVTLATCLEQDFDDYEIVVCDNCSTPATRAVVDDLASPRIRYVRSDEPLSMTDNWNCAYANTRGEFVMFLGDDDGLMPYALRELDALVRRHQVLAVRWNWAIYTWPDIAVTDMANYLKVCLVRHERLVDSHASIIDVLAAKATVEVLPNLYHSLVSRTILERIRKATGSVFAGFYPDTFTSFAVAYLLDRHLSVSVPMTVIGVSGTSNGIATIFLRNKHPVAREFREANARRGTGVHPWVPDLPVLESIIADSFLTAKGALFPTDQRFALDRRRLAERCVAAMPADNSTEQRSVMCIVRETLSDDPSLLAWFDKRYRETGPAPIRPPASFIPARLGFDGENLHLDAAAFGVEDVAGAVRLSCDLLGLGGEPIAYDVVAPDPPRGAQQRAASSSVRFRHRIHRVPAAVLARVRRALGRSLRSPP